MNCSRLIFLVMTLLIRFCLISFSNGFINAFAGSEIISSGICHLIFYFVTLAFHVLINCGHIFIIILVVGCRQAAHDHLSQLSTNLDVDVMPDDRSQKKMADGHNERRDYKFLIVHCLFCKDNDMHEGRGVT